MINESIRIVQLQQWNTQFNNKGKYNDKIPSRSVNGKFDNYSWSRRTNRGRRTDATAENAFRRSGGLACRRRKKGNLGKAKQEEVNCPTAEGGSEEEGGESLREK